MEPTANTIINQNFKSSSNFRGTLKDNAFKILVAVMVLAILGETVWAIMTLTKTNAPAATGTAALNTPRASVVANPVGTANLSFQSEPQVVVGKTLEVSINLTTSEPTDGTDVIVKYDPALLQAQTVTPGTIYDAYPAQKIDSKTGTITLSAIATGATGFSGNGAFAKVTFKALKAGSTTLSLDYQDGSTTESNVMSTDTGKDILNKVDSLKLTITK